jgi:transposase
MESRRYSTDLSYDEWLCIDPHLPRSTGRERPRLHGLRAILDAVFYVLKSGCPWRLLPREFPPCETVLPSSSMAGVAQDLKAIFKVRMAKTARALADEFMELYSERFPKAVAVFEAGIEDTATRRSFQQSARCSGDQCFKEVSSRK